MFSIGHVVLAQKKAHILLVTLNKQGRADAHKFMDHGRVRYQSHQGSRPMSIVFGLDAAVGSFAGYDL